MDEIWSPRICPNNHDRRETIHRREPILARCASIERATDRRIATRCPWSWLSHNQFFDSAPGGIGIRCTSLFGGIVRLGGLLWGGGCIVWRSAWRLICQSYCCVFHLTPCASKGDQHG